ncbi:Cyclin-SDS [Prunus dulcis]|uniref:Cyclin-SDS n=1 Tax=Prunus dulcis TaxID=3755 RepID=A0A4Y1QRW4_PRUDU|nr:Cyclin-SDS [Prunus dulcis]
MKFKSIQAMQNLQTSPYLKTRKKLRSELPRRRRSQISPVLYSSLKFNAPSETSGFSSFSVNSTPARTSAVKFRASQAEFPLDLRARRGRV